LFLAFPFPVVHWTLFPFSCVRFCFPPTRPSNRFQSYLLLLFFSFGQAQLDLGDWETLSHLVQNVRLVFFLTHPLSLKQRTITKKIFFPPCTDRLSFCPFPSPSSLIDSSFFFLFLGKGVNSALVLNLFLEALPYPPGPELTSSVWLGAFPLEFLFSPPLLLFFFRSRQDPPPTGPHSQSGFLDVFFFSPLTFGPLLPLSRLNPFPEVNSRLLPFPLLLAESGGFPSSRSVPSFPFSFCEKRFFRLHIPLHSLPTCFAKMSSPPSLFLYHDRFVYPSISPFLSTSVRSLFTSQFARVFSGLAPAQFTGELTSSCPPLPPAAFLLIYPASKSLFFQQDVLKASHFSSSLKETVILSRFLRSL